MVCTCAVYGCKINTGAKKAGLKFLRFPYPRGICTSRIELTNQRRRLWYDFLKRDDIPFENLKHRKICSKHFVTGQPAKWDDIENIDWVPTQYPPIQESNDRKTQRCRRSQRRKKKSVIEDVVTEMDESDDVNVERRNDVATQTDFTFQQYTELENNTIKLSDTITALRKEIIRLRKINAEKNLVTTIIVRADTK